MSAVVSFTVAELVLGPGCGEFEEAPCPDDSLELHVDAASWSSANANLLFSERVDITTCKRR